MSKQLTPLEALKRIEKDLEVENIFDDRIEDIVLIEKSLKAMENFSNEVFALWKDLKVPPIDSNDQRSWRQCIFDYCDNKLKALEIMKEKGCSYMETALIVSCNNYEEYCFEMNSGRVYSSRYECGKAFKTQEEFDLLKEILK